MIYLDYSATTPPDKRVLQAFCETGGSCGNYNASNSFGRSTKVLLDSMMQRGKELLNVSDHDIICVSGATEANNLAIKGAPAKGRNKIITTNFEHSSVYAPITYMQKKGAKVVFVRTLANGIVDVAHLEELLDKDTYLVSIAAASSEVGYLQPLNELGTLIHSKSAAFFHVDATQAIGKAELNFSEVDFVSLSAHKFYGIKGIGMLLKRQGIRLAKEIGGGHSLSKDRSGTPPTELIVSMIKALEVWDEEKYSRIGRVANLRRLLENELKANSCVRLNNPASIPHIVNISVDGRSGQQMQHYLDEKGIAVSVGSACTATPHSKIVFEITGNMQLARESFRISLSHLTIEGEILQLVSCLRKVN